MYQLTFIFIFFTSISSSQTLIGKIEGASITLEDGNYEVIFQSESDYVSFYINHGAGKENGLDAIKMYVFRLFEEKDGDYLLQFEHDSLLLAYENDKVQMTLWRQHDGDQRSVSKWFSKTDYLELFGEISIIDKM